MSLWFVGPAVSVFQQPSARYTRGARKLRCVRNASEGADDIALLAFLFVLFVDYHINLYRIYLRIYVVCEREGGRERERESELRHVMHEYAGGSSSNIPPVPSGTLGATPHQGSGGMHSMRAACRARASICTSIFRARR
jgi:hypothetical protein